MLMPLAHLDMMELSSIVLLKHSQTCSPDPTPLALATNGSMKSTSTYRCLSLLFSASPLGLGTGHQRNGAPQGGVFYPFFYQRLEGGCSSSGTSLGLENVAHSTDASTLLQTALYQ